MASPLASRVVAVALGLLLLAPVTRAQDSSPNGPTFPNIASNCNAYHTVVDGDGCWSIAQTYSITVDQFYEWNPDIADDCGTNFWPGYAYCVGVGPSPPSSVTYTPPATWPSTCQCTSSTTSSSLRTSSSSSTSSSTTGSSSSSTGTTSQDTSGITSTSVSSNTEPYTTLHPITNYTLTATTIEEVFPPTKTQAGQPADCNDWRLTTAWDTCDSIVASNSWLTLENLLAWNPILGSDCSGLYDGWWVCISVRPSSNIDIGWTTTAGTVSLPTITANYTPTTLTPVDASFTASPTQAGLVSGCKSFYQAKDGDTCRVMVDGTLLTESDFFAWNPALNGDCNGLWLNYWYCVVGPNGITAMPPTVTTTPAPVPPNQIVVCKNWYQRDGESCAEIAAMFGTFSEQDFISWNSNVGSTCNNLVDGFWYCVAIPGTPTTRTEPVQTTDMPDATPTQDGMTATCAHLWLVGPRDTCESIEEANGITEAQFLQWNPALGATSCTLTRDYYVCVSVDGPAVTVTSGPGSTSATSTPPSGSSTTSSSHTTASSSSTTTPATSTTTSSGNQPITTPTPTRDGMVSGCHRFYFAQDGDGCWAIANSAGIDLNDFYTWNPVVGTDCGGLWLGYYYCIGIAGPVTTISSGPPVPT